MKIIRIILGLMCLCSISYLIAACSGGNKDDIIDEYQDDWEKPKESEANDLTFWYVFDPSWTSSYANGVYTHQVWVGFGVSSGHYSAGITKFGIALSTPDGTVTTTDGEKGNNKEVTVTTTKIRGKEMKFYWADITNDIEYDWDGFFTVNSKSKTIKIEYVCRYYNSRKKEWVETDIETHYYTPKSVRNN